MHPIIQERGLPGSIIHSDEWRAYTSIAEHINFAHEIVNHRRNIVNPDNNAHTQAVESLWNKFKRRCKEIMGTSQDALS